jgi:hypothetical protein
MKISINKQQEDNSKKYKHYENAEALIDWYTVEKLKLR